MNKIHALAALTLFATARVDAAPVTYDVDPAHTYPSFEADHMGISVWRGKIDRTHGTIVLDRAAGTGTVDLEFDPASIDFGLDKLDQWAVGDKFLDVARFPKATYKGHLAGFSNGAPTEVVGDLELHGVTHPVKIAIRSFKCIPHPMLKREVCGADATASFDRDAFGLDAGKDYGFRMNVDLRIQVEAIARAEDEAGTAK